jgi:hypothetical protein
MKNGRRVFDINAKKKHIVAQPVTFVYGGFKANSSGFCDCTVFELYFVPNHNRKKKEDSDIKFAAPEENSGSVDAKDDASHISKLSLETSEFDEMSSSFDCPLRSMFHTGDSLCGGSTSARALKLKSDCSTQLLSPKRGVDGHYFDLKSALSYSKSSFIPSSSKVKPPESEQSPSHLDALSHKGGSLLADDEDGDDVSVFSKGGSVLSAERMLFMSHREIMKTRTKEIAPKTKGMTVHNARSVYNRLYPLPGLPSSLKKRAQMMK